VEDSQEQVPIPAEVESSTLSEGEAVEAEVLPNSITPARGRGRPKAIRVNAYKMSLVEKFFNGEYEGERKAFLASCGFTDREKALMVKDPRFLDIADAMLFDIVFGLKTIPKEQVRIFEVLTRRLGMWKGVTINAKHTSIRVEK